MHDSNTQVKLSLIFFGIGAGIFVAFAFAILLVNEVPFYVSDYLPIFIGGFIANLIANNKPYMVGSIVGILMALGNIFILWLIAGEAIEAYGISSVDNLFEIIVLLLLYLPCGTIGAYLGHFIRTRRGKRKV